MRPPALARLIVRQLAAAEDRRDLVDDLAERFGEIAGTQGLRAARRWYWRQAVSAVPWRLRSVGDRIRLRSWAGAMGDVRSGARTVRRSPLYAAGVAGTLGLGLAAATITFVVAWHVWLAPMPYPDPERVVRLYEVEPAAATEGASGDGGEAQRHPFSRTLLEDFRAHRWRTIGGVSAVLRDRSSLWRRGDVTLRISRVSLSPDGFGILGIVPTLGRLPSVSEREVLVSERFWRSAFGGDSSVIGTRMTLDGRPVAIAGVGRVPAAYPGDVDIVYVIDLGGSEDRGFRDIETIARVRPEHTPGAATAELNAFLTALAETHPEHRGWRVEAAVLGDDLMRPYRGVLALLLAAGATFLLLAGVNVMGLVAARRVEGRHDRSIRLALGASEGRLLRGSLVEGVLLAVIGSVGGVLSAYWLIGPIRARIPFDVPRLGDVAVTAPIMTAGLCLGAALGLIIGLAGYLVSRGVEPAVGRAPVWRAMGTGGRRALVVGQVALTTLLTAGGAAILQRVATLHAIDLGFEPEGLSMTSTLIPDDVRYDRWQIVRSVLDASEARGLQAAMALNTPMSGDVIPQTGDNIPKLSVRADAASEEVFYELQLVSANYFRVMGIELLAGRPFGPGDHASAQRVVIASEEFVDRYFGAGTPPESVIGRALGPMYGEPIGPVLVGVVRSTRHDGPDAPLQPEIYQPLSQLALAPMTLLVRGEPDDVADAVASVLARTVPDLRWTPLTPYTWHLKEWFAPLRLQITAIGGLGGLGLLLVSLGLYSLMAHQVTTRRKELGIRKAVGATDRRLIRGVLASGVTLATVGAVIGLAAWYRLLPRLGEFVEGMGSAGSVVPLAVALVIGGSCMLATLVPALRVTRIDPSVTLKAD